MIGITILGSTGSIGEQTLDVISRHRNAYQVIALTGNKKIAVLYQQCIEYKPHYAVMTDESAAEQLEQELRQAGSQTKVLCGSSALNEVAQLAEVDCVVAGIVGAAGLESTLAAVDAGKRVLLANKEALVMAGPLIMQSVIQNDAQLIPIDSEHNAIFQCLPRGAKIGESIAGVDHVVLTASGGPFINYPLDTLSEVTPEQACQHPRWKMGRKISVDSATMMNKGLEVIEAHYLFNLPPDKIKTVLHPQSIIHSVVAYKDGSMLAQLGHQDMRIPIANGLGWPERISSGVETLDLIKISELNFYEIDYARYPCLYLAYQALKHGGTSPTILNAANEVAVNAFLNKKIPFTDIVKIIETTLFQVQPAVVTTLEDILGVDRQVRHIAREAVTSMHEKECV